jgi:prepilin-type N-terminal cleavage/methylation domain-containing protein
LESKALALVFGIQLSITKLINMKVIRGFTLVEMAVVLMILGLLLGSLLIPLSAQMDQQKIRVTQQRLEEIKEALIGFAILNGYLPCPALDKNGKAANYANSNGRVCQTYDDSDGYLPWLDLGVKGYDAWGRPFRYRVDGWFSNCDGIYIDSSNPGSVGATKHQLKITDSKEDTPLILNVPDNPDDNPDYKSNVVAIVFSCGKNGLPDGNNDADDTLNSNAQCSNEGTANNTKTDYIQDGYIENQFDDILVWLPKNILINQLAATGKWPPSIKECPPDVLP